MIRAFLIVAFLAAEAMALIAWLAYGQPVTAAVIAVFGIIPLWAAGQPRDRG